MSKQAYTETPLAQQSPPTRIDEMPYCGVWKRENNTKVPYNPSTGQRAKSNDPRTFGTRAQVDRALATGKYEGRCYLIHESLGVTAGDLDHVIPEADAFNEAALPPDVRRIIRIANTYTTWSPSGTGIRFFFSAIDPTYKSTNKSSPSRKVCPAEAYRCLRFMTDTAIRIADTPDAFNDDPGDLDAWFEALGFEKREIEQPTPIRPASTYTTGPRTNADILELAFRAKNGDTIRRLYDGDISGYPESQSDPGFSSEADLALVSRLSFYVDDEQLVDLWRSSGLYRPKLDRSDYVNRTITKARAGQSGTYSPGYAPPPRPEPMTATSDPQDITDGTCADVRAELEAARETITQLRRDKSMLLALLLNPYVTAADKTAVAATLDMSLRKRPGEDGLVTLKPGEISGDWRPKPEPGENTDPLNRDGSKPRMPRSSVRKTMLVLTARGLNAQKATETVTPKNGRRSYEETVWRVRPPEDMGDFLAPIALFTPAEAPVRKPRTIAPQCLGCGVDMNVTTWTTIVTEMTCPECGELHREERSSKPRTVNPIVSIDPDARAAGHGDNLSPVESTLLTGDKLSPCSASPVDNEPPDYWSPPGVAGDDPWTTSGWRSA
jgi:putative DNA primase/helicase